MKLGRNVQPPSVSDSIPVVLTLSGHAAVETFLEATSLAAVATVATDGAVARILTRVRTVSQPLLVLNRSSEETLTAKVHRGCFQRETNYMYDWKMTDQTAGRKIHLFIYSYEIL